MATPISDQDTQREFFSPRKLLNEAISIITQNFTPSKFTNCTVYVSICIYVSYVQYVSLNTINLSLD